MVHPYKHYREDKAIENMDKISVTLEMCTIYNGRPHGIAIISHADPEKKWF